MLEPPTGWQFVLERPGQRAVVTEVGAALRSWEAAGTERLDGFGVDATGDGVSGKVLAPWPDRGPLSWVNWRPVRRAPDRVSLAYVLHPEPEYPYTLGVEVEYALQPAGLDVALTATNLGDGPGPFGAGFRPRIRAGEPVAAGDGGSCLRAGAVSLWADGGFARCFADPDEDGVTLVCDTGDGLFRLAPGEVFAGRWGLVLDQRTAGIEGGGTDLRAEPASAPRRGLAAAADPGPAPSAPRGPMPGADRGPTPPADRGLARSRSSWA